MDERGQYTAEDLVRFKSYLRFLAQVGLDPRLSSKLDPSDIVQTVFVKACESFKSLRATTDAQVACWLRTIARNTISSALSNVLQEQHRLGHKVSMEVVLAQSSIRIDSIDARKRPASTSELEKDELILKMVAALEGLPTRERQAIILQRWHKWSVAEIAVHLGKSESGVAKLLRRGIERLQGELKALE